jgi:thioredoxin reductase (NADPH)
MYDVLIIGSGPAGVSAALTLKAKGAKVAVTSLMGSCLQHTALPKDYYGLTATDGDTLYKQGLTQMEAMEIPFFEQEIVGLELDNHIFTAIGKTPLQAKRVILATGKPQEFNLPSFCEKYLDKGVHLRAEEQGFLYRTRMVGVVGVGEYALAQVKLLSRIARTVTLFTNGETVTSFPKEISVNRYPIKALGGSRSLETITFENGTTLNIDGLFFARPTATALDLAAGVGIQTQSPYLWVDETGQTTQKGLYAVGDCTGKACHLHTQTHDGYTVAQQVWKSL